MKRTVFLLSLVTALTHTPALADSEHKSRSIKLQGFVPVVCHANYQPAIHVQDDGVINLGFVQEFCNSSRGYRVVVEYAPTASPGAIIVDGQEIELNGSGQMVLAEVSGPAILSRALAYRPGDDPIASLRVRLQSEYV